MFCIVAWREGTTSGRFRNYFHLFKDRSEETLLPEGEEKDLINVLRGV